MLAFIVVIITLVAVKKPENLSGPKQPAEFIVYIDWPVDIDADVDLWEKTPSGKMLFYSDREVGCSVLDRDSRGFLDSVITLSDGSKVKVDSYRETVSIRCLEFGHYDFGIHLYDMRIDGQTVPLARNDLGLKVHVEVMRINPRVETLYASDVVLNRRWDTVNWVSFDMAKDGSIKLVDAPLEPITAETYKNRTVQ